ncbi:hypothetical protein LZQ00_10845 [Sphingobacterium sp. SRCM116780]|uniref:hypothetical protein n=1 Tax=Sphingobacterium sp. SRCM116780 TaxID=2907623 RepID=UPI001F1D96E4|nr:hypothetical protein [Sphingobacterium sp. SRCM116780]UIR54773.1 hypothetical protein LZQ00_10845 [Sphingobacterium sp. SRCM116780]
MKEITRNPFTELSKIISQKSLINSMFGKRSPKSGRIERYILALILIGICAYSPFIYTRFYADWWIIYFLTISIIMYLLKKKLDDANYINKFGYMNLHDKLKYEIYQKIKELELDFEEFEAYKKHLRNFALDNKTNIFSWPTFFTITSIVTTAVIGLYAIAPENIDILKLGTAILLLSYSFWYFFKLIESEILNRKYSRYYELYLIFSSYRKEDLK